MTTTREDNMNCPRCNHRDGTTYIGKGRWAYCLTHRTKWLVSIDSASQAGWRERTEDEQRAEYARLDLGEYVTA